LTALEVITTSVATKDVRTALADISAMFNITPATDVITMGTRPVQAAFASYRLGNGSGLGFMESTDENSPVSRFIKRRGEGLFSVTLRVDDLAATLTHLHALGVEAVMAENITLTDAHIGGRHIDHGLINFIRPGPKTHGLVFELVETSD
jgi:hypothetical protein